jgi:hypothetical protein
MLAAAGVGLFALYSWVLLNYGLFNALAAMGGVLTRTLLPAGMVVMTSIRARSAA